MIKLLGAALLMAGCGAVGLAAVGRLDGRVRDLRELTAGLETLRRELGGRLTPLPGALNAAADGTHGRAAGFFAFCANHAEHLDGAAFHEIWRDGLEQCRLQLTGEDRVLLEQLGPVLGRYDADSQLQAIEGVLAGLGRRQVLAEEERQRMGRVYGVLGMTAGVFLVILLI